MNFINATVTFKIIILFSLSPTILFSDIQITVCLFFFLVQTDRTENTYIFKYSKLQPIDYSSQFVK